MIHIHAFMFPSIAKWSVVIGSHFWFEHTVLPVKTYITGRQVMVSKRKAQASHKDTPRKGRLLSPEAQAQKKISETFSKMTEEETDIIRDRETGQTMRERLVSDIIKDRRDGSICWGQHTHAS